MALAHPSHERQHPAQFLVDVDRWAHPGPDAAYVDQVGALGNGPRYCVECGVQLERRTPVVERVRGAIHDGHDGERPRGKVASPKPQVHPLTVPYPLWCGAASATPSRTCHDRRVLTLLLYALLAILVVAGLFALAVWVLPKGRSALSELAEARRTWQGAFHVEPSVTDAESEIIVGTGVRARNR